jgi:DNA-binding NtrC family response regulator
MTADSSDSAARPVVLVLDDDVAIRTIWCHSLTKAGYTVLPAGTVDEALAVIKGNPPAACIVDRNLPGGKNGDDFIDSGAYGDAIPFVVTASEFGDEYETSMYERGARFVLRKPVSVQKLIACVREACKLYSMRKRLQEFHALVLELQKSIDGAVEDVKRAVSDSKS